MLARALLGLVGLAAACAPTPKHSVPLAVLVDGAPLGALPTVGGLALRSITLPAPATTPGSITSTVAQARAAYAQGDLDACRTELARVDLARVLASGDRVSAARALVLETACAWAAMDKTAAHATALRLATLGLELPDLAVSPDVERVIGDAVTKAGSTTRVPLSVEGIAGGRLTIDGRDAGCALPCTLDVLPGDHVVSVDTDGYQPATRLVRVEATTRVEIAQDKAPPELAARQWRARVGRGHPPADAIGAQLLGRLAREPRVAFIQVDQQLAGTLVVDGKVVARAQRSRDQAADLFRSLAYDGGLLQRPSVWQRPTTWIIATGLAIALSAAIVYVVYEPDPTTRLVPP